MTAKDKQQIIKIMSEYGFEKLGQRGKNFVFKAIGLFSIAYDKLKEKKEDKK